MKKKTIAVLLASLAIAGCGRTVDTGSTVSDINADTEILQETESEEESEIPDPETETEEEILPPEETGEPESASPEEENASQGEGEGEGDDASEKTPETVSAYLEGLPYDNILAGGGDFSTGDTAVYYRNGPSQDYETLGIVPEETKVTVIGQCEDGTGWYAVDMDGTVVYMSNRWVIGDFIPAVIETEPEAAVSGEKEEEKEGEDDASEAVEVPDDAIQGDGTDQLSNEVLLDAEAVIEQAGMIAKGLGYSTTQERLLEKLDNGDISRDTYIFYSLYSRGAYSSMTVEASETDISKTAQLLCDRLLPEEGTAFQFVCGGELMLGGVRYVEFRCYTMD